MNTKQCLLTFFLLLPSILLPRRIMIGSRRSSTFPEYDQSYTNPLITPKLRKQLAHIDQDFLRQTKILNELQHRRILSVDSMRKFIECYAFRHYKPADYIENYHPLNDYTEWNENTQKTTRKLLTAIFLLAKFN